MGGHLFIVNGDLTKLACDAILVPTDVTGRVESPWRSVLDDREYVDVDWSENLAKLYSAVPGQPQIWLGRVGRPGKGSDFGSYAPTVEEFITQATAGLDGPRIYPSPKFRLAVNVVGSGRGGGEQKKGHLIKGLVGALTALADEHDVDIVLVTYGRKPYSAAQRARRKLIGTDDESLATAWQFDATANSELITYARRLADDAIARHLVLFIGAGASAGAGLPTWRALLGAAASAAGIDTDERSQLAKIDYRDQATLIERRLRTSYPQPSAGSASLKSIVAHQLQQHSRYSLQHGLLASLPSNEAVTTNFDSLFEAASRIDGQEVAVLPADPRSAGGRLLLKLHGSVNDPENMILTRSDYLNMPRRYGALMGLVQGLLLTRRMVFVGYSLSDEDFHELIEEVRTARGDSTSEVGKGVVLTLRDNQFERQLWEGDLEIVPITTAEPFDIPKAARELELFLDLVGYLSTTSAAFFLDETYSDLTDDESDLRDALTALAQQTSDSPPGTVAEVVRGFLTELGRA